ncbi:MAG: hypothetical protein GVY15_09035 [Bacteroidetes bacterium]|jgi:DNA polymerase-3 subunit epsilon|nr:hypothetical protein [Bacteroidota bacterium]
MPAPHIQHLLRHLELTRPLTVFDLETTGVDTDTDEIIDIGLMQVSPKGQVRSFQSLVNPRGRVSEEITELTGISEEMLTDAPRFEALLDELQPFFENSDLAGYNAQGFDLPMLKSAYARAGAALPGPADRHLLDAYHIFRKYVPHSLERAVQHYSGMLFHQEHRALSDVDATLRVLSGQVQRHQLGGALPAVVQAVRHPYLDADRKLKQEGDTVVFAFGKYKGTPVGDVIDRDPGYVDWAIREIGGEMAEILAAER